MRRPDVDKYEAMAAAATVGPWVSPWEMWPDEPENPEYPDDAEPDDCYFAGWNGERICYLMWYDGYHLAVLRDDAALMAAARTAIPELCAWIKHLEERLKGARDACPQEWGSDAKS